MGCGGLYLVVECVPVQFAPSVVVKIKPTDAKIDVLIPLLILV